MSDDLESRRARVRRHLAGRPAVTVEIAHAPQPQARESLVALLAELLDRRDRSGRR